MGKYVDSEKLIAEIKALKRRKGFLPLENTEITEAYMARGIQFACDDIVNLITSLQQEQFNKDIGTLITCDIIEMTVKRAIDKPQDKEKEVELMTRKINYLRSLEENYVQQEQPEVDNQ